MNDLTSAEREAIGTRLRDAVPPEPDLAGLATRAEGVARSNQTKKNGAPGPLPLPPWPSRSWSSSRSFSAPSRRTRALRRVRSRCPLIRAAAGRTTRTSPAGPASG